MERFNRYLLLLLAFCGLGMVLPNMHMGAHAPITALAGRFIGPGYPDDVLYGVNSFNAPNVRELPSGLTRFFFPGNTNARRVQLSGSFNSWTTQKGIMTRTDSGWVSDVRLEPGIYAYKYIINGFWTRDVANNLKENDGFGDYNSLYFRCNYTFRLAGFDKARRISVAGNFNKWNANELVLQQKGRYWEKQIYLHEGTHLYRFMVDGRWITDPANPLQATVNNTASSVLQLGERTNFTLNGYTNAKAVYVAGDFNNWKPTAQPMKKTAAGWELPLVLPKGTYQYKFVVDGRWITDPNNPHTTISDGDRNSIISLKPNHTFALKGFKNATEVRLAGDFNDWNTQGYTLAHKGDEWTIALRLKPGKYRYKFIVDGKWMLDPANRQWEQNEFNTGNSVLWIE